MNKYKNLLITTAISLAAVTSIVAVSATANSNALNVIANEPARNSSRTLTINKSNRELYLKAKGNTQWSTVAYQMNDKQAYGLIYTSQSQQDVYNNNNNAVFVLWDNTRTFQFDINPTKWDDTTVEIYGTGNPLTIVKYRHLTQIDFVLDKGNGSDRTFDLVVNRGALNFVEEPEGENAKIYRWTPNNAEGYISNEEISFTLAQRYSNNKAVWVRSITFHYDC